MEIHLTSDQQAFVRHAIEAGRIARPEDAAAQAMAMAEEHERRRLEILCHVDSAEGALSRGESIAITQMSMRQLAAEVKQRGRDRLAPTETFAID